MRPVTRFTRPVRGVALAAGSLLLVAACASAGSTGGQYGAAPIATSTAPASGAVAGAAAVPSGSVGSSGGRYGGSSGRYGGSSQPGAAPAGSVLVQLAKVGTVGTVLTGADGRTLYEFKKDGPDKSACTGACAANWPPLTVSSPTAVTAGGGVSGTFGTIARADGSLQVTYGEVPLYYFSGDQQAGQANGQGIGGVWFAATPGGQSGGSAATPSGYTY